MRATVIINGGLPRSGTVLVGAVLCAILERQDTRWIRYNPQERRHLPAFAERVRNWAGPEVLLVHTHLLDDSVIAAIASRTDALAVWNRRDPRDALVSLCRLHDLALPDGLRAMRVFVDSARRASDMTTMVRLRYEEIVQDRAALVRQMAGHLGAELDENSVADIAAKTSPERHAEVMRAVASGHCKTTEHPTRNRVLREDPRTLINDRHIQSGASGRWLTELSADERTVVQRALGPAAAALGYATG